MITGWHVPGTRRRTRTFHHFLVRKNDSPELTTGLNGDVDGNRTHICLIDNQVLYQPAPTPLNFVARSRIRTYAPQYRHIRSGFRHASVESRFRPYVTTPRSPLYQLSYSRILCGLSKNRTWLSLSHLSRMSAPCTGEDKVVPLT